MAIAQPTYLDATAPLRAGPALALVIALHIGVVAVLLSIDVLPLPAPLAALMVRVIQAPPNLAEITPPRPKPVTNKPVAQRQVEPARQLPLLAAETQAAAAIETQAPASLEVPAGRQILPPAPVSVAAPVPPAAAASEPRFDASYLDNPTPVYPALSRRLREEGQVVLRVFVDANGRANQIQISSSSGSPRLDQAAQDAVSRWKFIPAQRGAEAVGAWALVPIIFNLRG
jgi:protein TonB